MAKNNHVTEMAEILAVPRHRKLILAGCEADGRPLKRQAILQWMKRGVPPDRVLTVARVLKLPRYKIRPDVYPPPKSARRPLARARA